MGVGVVSGVSQISVGIITFKSLSNLKKMHILKVCPIQVICFLWQFSVTRITGGNSTLPISKTSGHKKPKKAQGQMDTGQLKNLLHVRSVAILLL